MSVYELWLTQGQGGDKIKEFTTLVDAVEYAAPRCGVEGSFAIKTPDGTWYNWNECE